MTHTVIGLFDSRSEAQAAMQDLVQEGFIRENIDISNRSVTDSTDFSADTISTGSGSGGGISGFFNSLFGDDETTANTYTNVANDADAILSVQVDSDERARRAAEILDRNGAIDVDERGSQYSNQNYNQGNYNQGSYNQQNFSETTDTSAPTGNYANTEGSSTAIPVIEEQLQVGKQQVESGGARIRSRIIEKPVEANVRLREEHVVVNRHPVNRDVTEADLNNFREGEIEIRERSEVPIVEKQARVVEEVEVGKTVTEREETISDTVRRTDVEVQETDTDITNNNYTNNQTGNR